MTLDEAITYALDDVRAARNAARLHPEAPSNVELYERALDGLLDARRPLAHPHRPGAPLP